MLGMHVLARAFTKLFSVRLQRHKATSLPAVCSPGSHRARLGCAPACRVAFITMTPSFYQTCLASLNNWSWGSSSVDVGAGERFQCSGLHAQPQVQEQEHWAAHGALSSHGPRRLLLSGLVDSRQRGGKAKGRRAALSSAADDSDRHQAFPERRCAVEVGEGMDPLPAFPLEDYGEGGSMIEKGFSLFLELHMVLRAARMP